MKKQTATAIAAVLCTPFLTQCVIEDSSGNLSQPTNVSGNAAKSEHVFEKGVKMGRHDGRSGLSRNPGRHNGQYPAAESDAFFAGYEKGYNQGIR